MLKTVNEHVLIQRLSSDFDVCFNRPFKHEFRFVRACLRSSVADPNGNECSCPRFCSKIEAAIGMVVFGSSPVDPLVSVCFEHVPAGHVSRQFFMRAENAIDHHKQSDSRNKEVSVISPK